MFESLKFTGRLFKKRPLRTLLTILQIAIGVWIVTIILTMNLQANDMLATTLDKFGGNIAQIRLQKETTERGYTVFESSSFTEEELELLTSTENHNIESVFIFNNTWQINLKANNLTYNLRGLTETVPGAITALDLNILEGNAFTNQDLEQKNTVALISQDIANQLFPNQSPVGQTIEIESRFSNEFINFEIIGVYEPISPLLATMFQETTMLIPLESRNLSANHDFHFAPLYHELYLKSYPGAIDDAVADAQILVGRDDFQISANYLRDIGSYYMSTINQMTIFYGALAFIAIIISSIGILSIMLVNVVERTREISLRKALGASRFSIVRQILAEGISLSILGALLGVGIAVITGNYMANALFGQFILQFAVLGDFHPLAALYACLMALIMGIIFGLYPAIQAARLPVVEGLRD